MADTTTAAPATADAAAASDALSSGAAASSTPTALRPLAELMTQDAFDVESVLAAQGNWADEETKPTSSTAPAEESHDDEGNDNADANAETAQADEEETSDSETSTETDEEGNEEDAEVVQDQNGKKLINVRHFNRMMRQRNDAKKAAREAIEKAAAAEAKAQAVEARLLEVEDKPVVVPAANDPLSGVATEPQLEATIQNATAWRNWARRNMHGGTPPIQGADEMTPDQVADALESAEAILEAAPAKRVFLREFSQKRAEIRKVMPQMFTDGTPEHQSAETYRRQLLNFRTAAEQDAIIAKLLKIDHQEREERDGVARYTRVALKKDAANQQGATTAKVVTTKPSPKPSGTAMTSQPAMRQLGGSTTRQQIAQRLRDAESMDVEELLAAGVA